MSQGNGHKEINWEKIGKEFLHPVKIQIFEAIKEAGEPLSPKGISTLTGVHLSTVAYHMKTLKEYKWVLLAEEVTRRGAVEHYYTLADDILCATQQSTPVEEK